MADLAVVDNDVEAQPGDLGGFRLDRVEVWNWGTFDQKVWTLRIGCRTSLLTGNIGSGKSTLVDAITTLLVPSQRITYNKAAGAESRERNLRSYMLGFYKNERSEVAAHGKPVALRSVNSVSVILATFRDQASRTTVSLAQVFYFKDADRSPEKLFVAAEADLSIREHFAEFGSDIRHLKARLRGVGAETWPSFPGYGGWFRRRMGIDSEQALDLFAQTVSMKQVGDLTGFVRAHMLDPDDQDSRITALIAHFEDLNRSHEAVVAAKRQTELLRPIVDDCDSVEADAAERSGWEAARGTLEVYFADIRRQLVDARLDALTSKWHEAEARRAQRAGRRSALQEQVAAVTRAIEENGGDRLAEIDRQVELLSGERDRRRRKDDDYSAFCTEALIDPPTELEAFHAQHRSLEALLNQLSDEIQVRRDQLQEHSSEFRDGRLERDDVASELESLRQRRSNIPRADLELREWLCRDLGLVPGDIPFAGELLKVRDDALEWEGAAERVLRPFALSLLVSDDHYKAVQRWVDATHLRGRIVYNRVRDDPNQRRMTATREVETDSLINKLEVHPEAWCRRWLLSQLASGFDFVCCDTPEQFWRHERALSRNGQIKRRGERHEKDDRRRIGDRSRYVLGWTNHQKILALEEELAKREADLRELAEQLTTKQRGIKELEDRIGVIGKLTVFRDFTEIDWRSVVAQIESLRSQRSRLLAASDLLTELHATKTQLDADLKAAEHKLDEAEKEKWSVENEQEQLADLRLTIDEELEAAGSTQLAVVRESIDAVRLELDMGNSTLASWTADMRRLRDAIQAKIDAAAKRIERTTERVIGRMQHLRHEFPAETTELDASLNAAVGYRQLLDRLIIDDLPRHEAEFRRRLNENTITEVVNFQAQLEKSTALINQRIREINESLRSIDYNPGRFIRLELAPTTDAEVRDFRTELRACSEGAIDASFRPELAEAKFLQVRELIERFRRRPGLETTDDRWRAKVTDVRNWFTFAASERWRDSDEEEEHYSDSSGKSGGQKEKLAYTVLAASLAYQYGLDGNDRSRSFRFVVIDEAFGRGSDDSARYALQLFERLGLQLLVVTPLQKIHVIEPFVHSVGFVRNDLGRESQLQNLTIEEYRARKSALRRP